MKKIKKIICLLLIVFIVTSYTHHNVQETKAAAIVVGTGVVAISDLVLSLIISLLGIMGIYYATQDDYIDVIQDMANSDSCPEALKDLLNLEGEVEVTRVSRVLNNLAEKIDTNIANNYMFKLVPGGKKDNNNDNKKYSFAISSGAIAILGIEFEDYLRDKAQKLELEVNALEDDLDELYRQNENLRNVEINNKWTRIPVFNGIDIKYNDNTPDCLNIPDKVLTNDKRYIFTEIVNVINSAYSEYVNRYLELEQDDFVLIEMLNQNEYNYKMNIKYPLTDFDLSDSENLYTNLENARYTNFAYNTKQQSNWPAQFRNSSNYTCQKYGVINTENIDNYSTGTSRILAKNIFRLNIIDSNSNSNYGYTFDNYINKDNEYLSNKNGNVYFDVNKLINDGKLYCEVPIFVKYINGNYDCIYNGNPLLNIDAISSSELSNDVDTETLPNRAIDTNILPTNDLLNVDNKIIITNNPDLAQQNVQKILTTEDIDTIEDREELLGIETNTDLDLNAQLELNQQKDTNLGILDEFKLDGNGLLDRFPFCLPFDLINCIKMLQHNPVTPRWEIPLKYGDVMNETIVIDFTEFEGIVKMINYLEIIGFILILIKYTKSLMKG